MFYLMAAVAAEAQKSGVDLTDLAALVTAIGGIIAGILAARKGAKADKATQIATDQDNILESYGQIVKDLQNEVERIRKMYIEDEVRWRTEKQVLLEQIKLLQELGTDEVPAARRRRKLKAPEDAT